ncbi:MAG: hypothetical protein ACTSYB_00065 [Candidatus Helarchaeota archaeon]
MTKINIDKMLKKMKKYINKIPIQSKEIVIPDEIKVGSLEEKISYLLKHSIFINHNPIFQDEELNVLFNKPLTILSLEEIEFLQGNEFNEITKREKLEIQRDILLLPENLKKEVISKFHDLEKLKI